ncbi:MAG: amidohydrolase [Bacteroidetes bacterium]|jgi:amidohydrolase|nr:amidohydrolase [Bacteroidota bacterium]
MENINKWLDQRCPDLNEARHHLHQHPELSGEEKNTQSFLNYRLKTSWPDRLKRVGDTGLLTEYKGESKGPCIMVRVDIDALPITEENKDLEYRSQNEGVSHKCGHDGHATIGLGLAHYIAQNRPNKGTVCILFQPAEETAEGAKAVLEDPAFDIKPDYVLGFHNIPGYPKESVVILPGVFSASVRSVIIRFRGQVAHAAEPEQGRSPAMAISALLSYVEKETKNRPNEDDFQLLTPIYISMGQKAYGTSPANGELHLTCRCWTPDQMNALVEKLEEKIARIAHDHGLQHDISHCDVFPAVQQNPKLVELLKKSVKQNGVQGIDRTRPFRWGEDFGAYSKKFPSLMFGLGAGEDQPVLHHPKYDFPDDIIPHGIKIFSSLINHLLNA